MAKARRATGNTDTDDDVVETPGSEHAPDTGGVFDTDSGAPLVVAADGTLTPLDDGAAYPTATHPEREARLAADTDVPANTTDE